MKKFFISAFMALTFSIAGNAQTVISNNYGSPITGADGQSINDDDEETLSSVSITYYEGPSFGLNFRGQSWNGTGMELNFLTDKSFETFEANLNINYSLGLWKDSDRMLLFTLAAGPTLRYYKDYEGNEEKSKFCSNLMIDPYFTFKINKIYISAGYALAFAKWKFKDRGEAFHIGLGYSF